MKEDFMLDISIEPLEYVIKSYKNLDRPKKDQMTVVIKNLSGRDESAISTRVAQDIEQYKQSLAKGAKERPWIELYSEYKNKWDFCYRIKEFKNFTFKIDGEVKKFTDPLELFNYEHKTTHDIALELVFYFKQLDTLPVKN